MDMDWEPEIPGQWNTPLRIRCQRLTVPVAPPLKLSFQANPDRGENLIDWEPEIPGQFNTPLRIRRKRDAAAAGFSDTVLDSRFYTPSVASINPISDYLAPITSILVYTFRIFHQICSATLRSAKSTRTTASAVAGSRHIIEIRETAPNGFESVKRRTIGSHTTRLIAPTAGQIMRKKMPLAQSRSPRSSFPKDGAASVPEAPIEQISSLVEADTSVSELQTSETPIDREALGAKLWARFTPPPIPGAKGTPACSQQPTSVPLRDGEPNTLSNPENAETKPVVEKPPSTKYYNIMSSKFDRPEKRIKPSLKSLPSQHELQNQLNDIQSDSKQLSNRRSLPQLSTSEMEGSHQLTRSHTISETPKQVRFAMNDIDGLPKEYSVRFYKDSKIGEWAPSSPWADEQALACTSDLKSNLDALLREDLWLPPPSTPVLNRALSYCSSEDQSTLSEEGFLISPENIDLPPEVSPNSISDSSPKSVDMIDKSDRQMTDRHLIDENPVAHAHIASPVPDSPYIRIKELVKDSIRKLFSSSPRVNDLDRINTDPIWNGMDISIANDKLSLQTEEASKPLSLLDQHRVSDNMPSNFADSVGNTLVKNEYNLGLSGSPIEIDGSDVSQRPVVEASSRDSAGYSSGPDSSKDSRVMPRNEEDSPEVELERVMKTLKMSAFGEEKLKRRRVAAAARRAANDAATAKAKAEADEAERKAHNHRRMPKEKLVKPLSHDWEIKLREAMGRGDNAALTTTITGTELRRKDFMTVLGERQWLNDEIINAYLEWVVDYANKKAGKDGRNAIPKVVAHNSFFYKNLSENGAKSVSRWMKRKKAEGKKLLEVETVLIPVNNASHWTIIVVSPRQRTIEYLDSFSGASKVFINHTKAWLREELGNAWREEEWRVLQTRSAVQNNGYDCGVFCITNAECVVGGMDTSSYDGSDMAGQRLRIAGVLLNRGFGGDFIPAEDL